jgi:hypothetical protein
MLVEDFNRFLETLRVFQQRRDVAKDDSLLREVWHVPYRGGKLMHNLFFFSL